jgi:hypothetical protein
MENLNQTKKKKSPFKFRTLIVSLLFYFMKDLLGGTNIVWDTSKPIKHKIYEHMNRIGDYKAHDDALIVFFVELHEKN